VLSPSEGRAANVALVLVLAGLASGPAMSSFRGSHIGAI